MHLSGADNGRRATLPPDGSSGIQGSRGFARYRKRRKTNLRRRTAAAPFGLEGTAADFRSSSAERSSVSCRLSSARQKALVQRDAHGAADDGGPEVGVEHLVTDHLALVVVERAPLKQGAAHGH